MTKNSKAKASRRQEEMDRRERVAQMRREAKAKERRQTWLVIGSAIAFCAILAGVVGVLAYNNHQKTERERHIDGLYGSTAEAGKLGREHTTDKVTYDRTPPVGGNHNPVWQNCGIYTDEQEVGKMVHDMEHGAVWITYGKGTSGSEIAKLQFIAREQGLYQGQMWTDVSPYTGLKANEIWASAWGYQVKLDNADDPRLPKFLKRFVHGEQTPEPAASCTGGDGTPKA